MLFTKGSTLRSEAWFELLFPNHARADWFLLACAGLLTALGLAFIGSASLGAAGAGGAAGLLSRQASFLAAGVAAFLLIQRLDYLVLLRWAPALYLAGLLLLCGVLAARPVNGARAWFDLYFFKLQPSEIVKPILILTMAHYLMYRESYGGCWAWRCP